MMLANRQALHQFMGRITPDDLSEYARKLRENPAARELFDWSIDDSYVVYVTRPNSHGVSINASLPYSIIPAQDILNPQAQQTNLYWSYTPKPVEFKEKTTSEEESSVATQDSQEIALQKIDRSLMSIIKKKYGWKVVEVAGDGNCMIRAACVSLGLDPDKYHLALRNLVCNYMLANKDKFDGFVFEVNFFAYVEKMREDGEWAGEVELKGLAYCLDVAVLVFKGPDATCNRYGPLHPTNVSPIMIVYRLNRHYEALNTNKTVMQMAQKDAAFPVIDFAYSMNPEGNIPLLYSLASPDHDKIVKQGVKLDSDGTFWVPEESVDVSLLKYMSQTTREILIAKNTSIEFSGGDTNSPTARSMDGAAAVPSSSSSPDERKKMEKKKKKSKKKKSKKKKPSLPKSPGPNEKKTPSSFLKQRKESASSDYSNEKPIKRKTDSRKDPIGSKDQKKSPPAPPKKKKKMTMKSRQEDASSDDDSSSIGSYESDNGWCIRDGADGRDDETYEDSSSYIYEDDEDDDESGERFDDDYNTEDYDSDESTLTLTDVGMSGDGSNYSSKDSDEKDEDDDEDDDEEDDGTTSDDSDATVSLASSGGDVAISKKQATIDECKPFAVQKKKSEGDDDSSMSGSGLSC